MGLINFFPFSLVVNSSIYESNGNFKLYYSTDMYKERECDIWIDKDRVSGIILQIKEETIKTIEKIDEYLDFNFPNNLFIVPFKVAIFFQQSKSKFAHQFVTLPSDSQYIIRDEYGNIESVNRLEYPLQF